MTESELRVHGSIFYLLRKYVISKISLESWSNILSKAGLKDKVYDITANYALSDIIAIISQVSELLSQSVQAVVEDFGDYMVPDLLVLYHNYLNPEWKTFEVLENTENVMHGAVRKLNSTAHPPILNVNRVNNNLLIIDYYSKRRMGSLAVGIIKGISKFFHEDHKINVISLSDPMDERVQIRVEYK